MVLAQQPELLLLDEPDSHLDSASCQLLIPVLADFPGTLLLVSLDPEFVAGVGLNRGIGWWERSLTGGAFERLSHPMCNGRTSQPSSGWLGKMGVLDFSVS